MKPIATFVFVLFVIVIALVYPLLLIWALNTLFPVLSIPYTVSTYFAALILNAVLVGRSVSSK